MRELGCRWCILEGTVEDIKEDEEEITRWTREKEEEPESS